MTRHNFNTEQCGAVFSAIAIGSILATILSIYQEKLAKKTLAETQHLARRTTLLPLSRRRPPSNRTLLVRMDELFLYPVDLARLGHRLRSNGHLCHLPRCLQLPGRCLSPICLFCSRGPVVYAKHLRGRVPSVYEPDVHKVGLRSGCEFAGRNCGAVDDRAVGVAVQGRAGPREESDRKRNHARSEMNEIEANQLNWV